LEDRIGPSIVSYKKLKGDHLFWIYADGKPLIIRSAIPASQCTVSLLPNAIGRQVIGLLANRVAAALIVVPRVLLSVDEIQDNEFCCNDHGPFNSGQRRLHPVSFLTLFLNETGVCIQNSRCLCSGPFSAIHFLKVPRKPSPYFTSMDFQSSFGAVAEVIRHSISDVL
jgi:hypothetical protein